MRIFRFEFLVAWLSCAPICLSQGVITTVAGTDFVFPRSPMAASDVPLGSPRGLALDAAGNLYVSDSATSLVSKIDGRGTLTVVAGNGTSGYSGDGGQAINAALKFPRGLAFDANGNLYIADSGNNVVRKVTPDGIITTALKGSSTLLNPISLSIRRKRKSLRGGRGWSGEQDHTGWHGDDT